MRNVSKGLKNICLVLLLAFVVLTSCVSNRTNQSIVLVEPRNASVGVPLNDQTFVFKGMVGTEYELIIKKDSTGETIFQKSVVLDNETFSVKIDNGKLAPNTTYRWYVRVKGNDSKASELWKFTTKENSVPVISTPKPNGETNQPFGSIGLSWNAIDEDRDDLNFVVKVTRLGDTVPIYETTVATNNCVVKGLSQLTVYNWSVVAKDPWGATSNELRAQFTTKKNEPPTRIELKSPQNGETSAKFNNLLIEWIGYDNDLEDLKYTVKLTSNSTNNALLSGSAETSYTVSGLKPNTKYTLEIAAVDSYNESTKAIFSFTTGPNEPPSVPTLIKPSNGENINFSKVSNVVFEWNPSTDHDGDNVSYWFILIDPYGNERPRGPMAATNTTYSLSSSEFSNGKTYGWRVEARDAHEGVASSEKRTFTTFTNRPPYMPQNLTPSDGAEGLPNRIPRFAWKASDPDGDSLTFDIYIGESATALTLEATGLTSPEYETPRLFDFSKTYYWKVVVHDDYNDPVEGPVWSFRITDKNYVPTVPELVSPSDKQTGVAFNSATLVWKASTDKETPQSGLTYYVYIGKADSMALVSTVTGESNPQISRTVANFEPLTTYYWRIEVKDGFGNYAYSTTWEFTTRQNTAPYAPTNPNPKDGGEWSTAENAFSWQCSDPDGDQLSYELYISSSSNFSGVAPIIRNETNYVWTPPSTGTYYWYVVAKDPYGGEAAGPTWSFKVTE